MKLDRNWNLSCIFVVTQVSWWTYIVFNMTVSTLWSSMKMPGKICVTASIVLHESSCTLYSSEWFLRSSYNNENIHIFCIICKKQMQGSRPMAHQNCTASCKEKKIPYGDAWHVVPFYQTVFWSFFRQIFFWHLVRISGHVELNYLLESTLWCIMLMLWCILCPIMRMKTGVERTL